MTTETSKATTPLPLLNPFVTPSGGDVASTASHPQFRTTPKRFLVLFEFSILAFNNGLQWICFGNTVDETTGFFSISIFQLSWLISIFYFSFVVTALPAVAYFDKYGVRTSLMVASACNLVGGVLKMICTIEAIRSQYWLLLLSQAIPGVAQSFFLPVPAALSLAWFGEEERTVSTLIAAISNPLGGAAGMLLSTLFVNSENKDQSAFLALFGFISALNLVDFLLLLFAVDEGPESPPSKAGLIRQESFLCGADTPLLERLPRIWDETVPVITDSGTFLLLLGSGCAAGCGWTWTTLIAQIGKPFGLSQRLVGLMGFFNNVFGIPVGIVVSRFVDKHRVYKMPLALTLLSIILLSVLLTILLKIAPDSAQYHTAALFIALGGAQNLMLPLAFEAAAETTFPLNENVCAALLLMFAEISAIFFMNGLLHVLDASAFALDKQTASIIICTILTGVTLFSLVCILFGKVEMNRLFLPWDKKSKQNWITVIELRSPEALPFFNQRQRNADL